ncbi:ABC transporter substrate-binding protein [Proteus faecis]|uniref:ABC transporter substrate-binding protein n=1 Tax=Proteus faecis TaxID=2050967 RepID=UPI0020BDD130
MKGKLILSFFCLFFIFGANAKDDRLVILTTHSDTVMRPLMLAFADKYPDIKTQVVYRRVEIAERLIKNYPYQSIDIVMSSSANFYHHLDREGLLSRLPIKYETPDWLLKHSSIINDKVTTFGYSGIGIISNTQYLQKHQLPSPKSWRDLTDPIYQGHLTMTTPANSGTTQLMVENILQENGWEEGWKILLELNGNLASISARSARVSDAVARGIVGAGPVIDNYAFNHQKRFDFIDFDYFDKSIILPAYVAILAESDKHVEAGIFISFLLSEEGQEIVYNSDMAKIPLSENVLSTNSQLADSTDFILDSNKAYHRREVVNALFDQMITHNFPLMRQVWSDIHEAERQENKTSERLDAINKARNIASSVLISENEANSPTLQALFTKAADQREYSDQALAVLYQWRTLEAEKLEQARALLRENKSP